MSSLSALRVLEVSLKVQEAAHSCTKDTVVITVEGSTAVTVSVRDSSGQSYSFVMRFLSHTRLSKCLTRHSHLLSLEIHAKRTP